MLCNIPVIPSPTHWLLISSQFSIFPSLYYVEDNLCPSVSPEDNATPPPQGNKCKLIPEFQSSNHKSIDFVHKFRR